MHVTRVNGIATHRLHGLIEVFRAHPQAAIATLLTRQCWDDALAVEGRTETFESGGRTLERGHRVRIDWPRELGGEDSGPTSGESLLATLGACISQAYVLAATARGIAIDELEVTVEGQVDGRGIFQLAPVRAGLSSVWVDVRVHADADDATLEELGRVVTRTSPVYDSLANPVPLALDVQRRR